MEGLAAEFENFLEFLSFEVFKFKNGLFFCPF